jgi:tRNA(Ile)-lysidine synthase TilS/MesJ
MNAKKVKAIRRSCRQAGVDPEHVTYKVTRPQRRLCMGTVTLSPDCGRAIYHAMKEKARE